MDKKRYRRDLTQEQLSCEVTYDRDTGLFTWLRPRKQGRVGSIAGRLSGLGYYRIRLFGFYYHAHRLAWLYCYGQWPEGHLDHADGCRTNNRIANLREATDQQNAANSCAKSTNKSGHKGVCWEPRRRKWRAQVMVNRKVKFLGYFSETAEAAKAYEEAAKRYFGEFAKCA